MIKRSSDALGFNALKTGWLTWLGFALAALGWVLLLFGTTVADILIAKMPHLLPPAFHADLLDIAKTIIFSGFGLAIVGALQTGFGTLNRFFGAVLMRSTQRDNEQPRPVEPTVERPSPTVAAAKRRPYRMFPDGSVEVDTIVGTRLFKTMAEARDFI
jgi:hypothetical protein